MSGNGFNNYEQFRREILGQRSGPLTSPVEDMADEMYHTEIQQEFDSLWDKADSDDE